MPTLQDNIFAQLVQAQAPGAGIDIPQFQEQFLPSPPPLPAQITQSDPFGQALASFGAGLAQPIQQGQTEIGNVANAALAGLDVINADRAARNAAAQQQFVNQGTNAELSRAQGQTTINAEMANQQRDYYSGLLRNAGFESLLDEKGEADERVIEWAKIAQGITDSVLTNAVNIFDPEELKLMHPSGGLGIFQTVMDMLTQNLDVPTIINRVNAQQQAAAQQARDVQVQTRHVALQAKYPFLVGISPEELKANAATYIPMMKEFDAKQKQANAQPGIVDNVIDQVISPFIGGGIEPATPQPAQPAIGKGNRIGPTGIVGTQGTAQDLINQRLNR